ncbi:LytTR family DNA-binding domain-containing protein [Oscillibacter sp.]|uniref:LytTR family DNA-binding domain-containing protein n=1 Tax=Oscillibacter sp. TaxID=1945593 RepID=UPI002D80ABF7|nr:LytTR family transcriptional regulator DNA-binding domain-containing protein [Oscillibacter sp.]
MKIDVTLDPALEELLVKVLSPGETEELRALLARLEEPQRLTGFRGAEAVPLDPAEVLRFYGEDKEVRAQTLGGDVYTVRLRLYELEERLDRRTFVRVSHSEIVNWKRVTDLDLSLSGTIRVTLEGGVAAYVSRRYVKKIKEVLGI